MRILALDLERARSAADRRGVVRRHLADHRAGVRHPAVPASGAVVDRVDARRQLEQGRRRHARHRSECPRRSRLRRDQWGRAQLRADAVQRRERTRHAAGGGAQRHSDHRARARVQQHVREHDRSASAIDGDVDRLVHRAAQRRQGPASGQRDSHGTSALLRGVTVGDSPQGEDSECRVVPVHGVEDRRAGRRDHGLRLGVLRRQPERSRATGSPPTRRSPRRPRRGGTSSGHASSVSRSISPPCCSSAWSHLLQDPTTNKHGVRTPGEQQHEQATCPIGNGRSRRPFTHRCRLRQ